MLRQQLILAVALYAASAAFAAGEGSHASDLEKAQADVAGSRGAAAQAVGDATALMNDGESVRKEMRQVINVRPESLGSIDGVRPAAPDIDLDALMARYSNMGAAPPLSRTDEQLLVFISASVPKESLRRLARQAADAGAPLVLRGVVGGDFPATAEFMRDILGEQEPRARAMIDPTLFARFDVQQVPAVVLVPAGACVAGVRACPEATPAHVHVAGDVTLDYALDYIARTHPDSRPVAHALLARVGGTP
ncbi:type-F conjugative transfer system pilin assembly protein TrbC [Sulfurivermis fontis]|uniref:type-F conjugative transfer system pilin assembly protein TrbC n=1 Tax=Sulfurivermis fontis TaxID=1972068 RepID=UPI000FDB4633|nr:type-F conjugative transfer system pilin assembly protein TrbC [Sulfurivermis fontis]